MSDLHLTRIQGKDKDDVYQEVPVAGTSLRVVAQEYLKSIAEGNIKNHSVWAKIGFIAAATGASELTITPQGGDYVFPTAAMQMSIRSSDNTNDKASGTGALTVTIYYLDNTYAEQSETVTLVGTTWVDTVATNILRINNMRLATVGTSGKAAGNISLVDKATRAIVYGYIAANNTRQRQLIYTVPLGKTLYITWIQRSGVLTAANKYMRTTLRATYDDKSGAVLTAGKFFMPFSEVSMPGGVNEGDIDLPIKLPATVDIKCNVITDGTAQVQMHLRGWLES